MSSKENPKLSSDNLFSIYYHDIFNHPLNVFEMVKWQPGKKLKGFHLKELEIKYLNGYFFLKGNNSYIFSKNINKRISLRKLKIARLAARVLKKIPSIKSIVITGSLAMLNSSDRSDIDLMIITQKGSLWFTRAVSIFLLKLFGLKVRKSGDKNEKDKICINIWLDESNLTWSKNDRNFYSAHEIAQTVLLFDRDKTYQKFLGKNIWIKDYWPNAIKIKKFKNVKKPNSFFKTNIGRLLERIFFSLQKIYMKNKRTREVVQKDKAIFHPIDRSSEVIERLEKYLL